MKEKKSVLLFMWIFKALVAGIVAVLILSGISFPYKYTGIHITNHSHSTDYVWQKKQLQVNMEEGFSCIRMDENGFNNASIPASVDILLMGSSHMEACQVNQNENCAYLLNEYLPEYNTYNIGISGHTIYRIADNLESALVEFSPSTFVIIETNTVQLDIEKMNEVLTETASPIKSYDSGLLFYLQKIPVFKPMYNQLENWISLKPSKKDTDSSEETVISPQYKETLYSFLESIKATADTYGVKPVIFYGPNESLSPNGELLFATDDKYFDVYKETCNSLGIIFIDMSPVFQNLYKTNSVLAHGFANTAVGMGHLNKYGHKAIAETLVGVIEKEVKQ